MAFSKRDKQTRTAAARDFDIDLSGGGGDWPEEQAQGRDWKKAVLVIGLGALSWVATYIGMLELIEANMGELPLVHKLVIGFSVAMLMTMIIWLLDQMFAPIPTATKLAYVGGYAFLTLISVGFGFGFYWKVLESRSESSRSAESAVTQVQSSLHAASTRMTQLSATLEQLTQVSTEKAEIERTKGASCPNSRPGDGPRRKLRDEDAQRFSFAAAFVKGRVESVKTDLTALDGDLAKVVGGDSSTIDKATGTRNDFMKGLGRKLDLTVTGFNAFRTDPQLKQLRADLADRAERSVFPDGRGGTFVCPDVQLQQALKGVVRAIEQLPELEKPRIAAVEGSEATIEAFRRLTATFYGALAFKLPPSADELRELQKKAVQSVEASPATQKALAGEPTVGLSKRDYIPLAIALFVDLCLLLVSMSRPMNRLNGLVPKMRAAERGPVIQILSRFNEIHRDDEIRQNFEVFRHVVFDFHGAYYVAVPLDAPYKPAGPYTKGYSTDDVEDLRLEAQLLANLFTSFEKEKIFSRVYSPLLTTRAVKKKLMRQGSKFAHSDAFRVYRFRDGAWSEIILGAVMGAARRVEAEKAKRRLEKELFTSREPQLSAANDQTQPATAVTTQAPELVVPPLVAEPLPAATANANMSKSRGGFFARRAAERATAPAAVHPAAPDTPAATIPQRQDTDASTTVEFGPYAARANREIEEELYRSSLPTLRGEDDALDRPRPRRNQRRTAQRDEANLEIPGGEVVLFALPGAAPADEPEPGPPKLAETAPAPRAAARPHAAPVSGSAAPQAGVDVVLTRETARFSMPVTEASLPRGVLSAEVLFEAEREVAAASPPSKLTTEPVLLSPPLDAATEASDDVDVQSLEPLFVEPEIDINIEDISRRFRPSAAE